jgi:arsenite methyltransferase
MFKRIGVVAATVAILWGWGALSAQSPNQPHHPPQSASEYGKCLEDPGRDEWQQPDRVIQSLDLRPGDEVADLGSGSGYFTLRLARQVGPDGMVYAVDIDPKLLEYLEQRAQEEQLDNVETILAEPHNPKLGSSSVDMIFICDVLHHISDRKSYYPLLAQALKPGGRLIDIDFQKGRLPLGPPEEMKIDKKTLIKEMHSAGFELTKEFDFLKYQYFLEFEH